MVTSGYYTLCQVFVRPLGPYMGRPLPLHIFAHRYEKRPRRLGRSELYSAPVGPEPRQTGMLCRTGSQEFDEFS